MKLIFTLCLLGLFSNSFAKGDSPAFNEALGAYEKVHQAFFDRDLKKAQESSGELAKALAKIKGEEVLKTLNFAQKKLQIIQKTNDIKEAHKSFNVVSQGMLVVLEKNLPNKGYARYYCPMVKKYWIQNITKSDKVMNPYASDSMPHCGAKMGED